MNPDNYCTLPIAKRLHEEGIVVETDMAWKPYRYDASKKEYFDWRLTPTNQTVFQGQEGYPAPTLAEVWRELPRDIGAFIESRNGITAASTKYLVDPIFSNLNPTDAACLLLLWVRGEK